ncbi:hypothetical protein SLH49_09275 [Cognatiyoonia sp. IB215446]|uniref:hypothetical protein n=1 Tax=Cognatiyoonia sp. IB215446 TaxID=3097355 RepID=UPI002A0DAC14|nr:hypothetical protein [Cognatiyoonia sp. IB215446]MDX8348177.1 hypothetical protein [Cognatiyoonia sp. IB215446]
MAHFEFLTEEDRKQWLMRHDRSAHTCFATRSALRTVPRLAASPANISRNAFLTVARAIIVAAVAAKRPSLDLKSFARSATGAVYKLLNDELNHFQYSVYSSEKAVGSVFELDTVDGANSAASAYATPSAVSKFDRYDAKKIEDEKDPAAVFDTFLWPRQEPSDTEEENLRRLKLYWQSEPDVWGFWEGWYVGFLKGVPVDWDVQQEVAQLSDEDWSEGPERIAERIAEIETRVGLENHIQELQKALIAENGDRHGIGGNNPPEAIETFSEVSPELLIVWEPLTELQQQAQSKQPNMSIIKGAINKLTTIAVGCGAWTWEKANVFLDASLKTSGAAAGTAAIAFATGHGDKIIAVIKAAWEWMSFL